MTTAQGLFLAKSVLNLQLSCQEAGHRVLYVNVILDKLCYSSSCARVIMDCLCALLIGPSSWGG